jgi:hypothetical protein
MNGQGHMIQPEVGPILGKLEFRDSCLERNEEK